MRTIRTKIFKFDELNENAKQVAISNFRQTQDFDYIWDEAHDTVKAFNEVFNLSEGTRSWMEYRTNFDDDIENLKGFRLKKYIWNNFKNEIFTGKYYSKFVDTLKDGTKIEKSNEFPIGQRLVTRHSRITLTTNCPLTGVYYDLDILDPIYNFLDNKDDETTFSDLLDECFSSLKKSVEGEIEARETDEYVIEEIEDNEMEFTANGMKFHE